MKKCVECGKQFSDSSTSCPYCGAAAREKLYCPRCNSDNLDFDVNFKSDSDAVVRGFFGIFGVFVKHAMKFSEDNDNSVKVIYLCKNCGYRFKIKQLKK